jgi:hypothetical protein
MKEETLTKHGMQDNMEEEQKTSKTCKSLLQNNDKIYAKCSNFQLVSINSSQHYLITQALLVNGTSR